MEHGLSPKCDVINYINTQNLLCAVCNSCSLHGRPGSVVSPLFFRSAKRLMGIIRQGHTDEWTTTAALDLQCLLSYRYCSTWCSVSACIKHYGKTSITKDGYVAKTCAGRSSAVGLLLQHRRQFREAPPFASSLSLELTVVLPI